MPSLSPALVSSFASIALDNVVRQYPNKLDHVMNGEADVATPRALHPAFYGSYDWHSCVHMHWLLARLLRITGDLPQAAAIAETFDSHLSREAIAGEVGYLGRASTQTFERTYGWAWLLKLAQELGRGEGRRFRDWQASLAPLADAFVARYLDWLPRAAHPLRIGMHVNTAFGLAFALDYARSAGEAALASACEAKALDWYANDRDYPAGWEPSGADFFSPALIEADLMRRVLAADAFAHWLGEFLPRLAEGMPASLFSPTIPTDRSDGQIVHLDGLNLSRAWCFAGIASALPTADPRVQVARQAHDVHLAAGLQGIESGDYMGEHWLASFAALALTGP
jgi:Protein of unknown function (DUF2891)